MSESIQPTPFRKLNYTPFCDLIRGRVTGRLDVKLAIEGSELPEPGKALVRRIVRRTRLWRIEKYEVATELVAHFRDGMESGESIEQLIGNFGNEKQAAKLIRRGKIRNRPMIWHFGRAIVRGIFACIVFYSLAALYFFAGRPTPSVDYIAILNRPSEQILPDQRAWPIYRDLHLTFYDHNSDDAAMQFGNMILSRLGDENYPKLIAWLENHQRELDIIRSASTKPGLGIIFPPDGVSGQIKLSPRSSTYIPLDAPTLGAALGPYQYIVASDAKLLAADIALAARSSDSRRIIRDITDASRIADQLRQMQFLAACEAAIEVRENILIRLNDVLVEYPQVLSDPNLMELAHMLGKPGSRAELMTYQASRILLEDVVQRMYTDTSRGFGRLTPIGVEAMIKGTWTVGDELARKKVFMPLYIIAGPSRAQVLREANRNIDSAEADLNRPMREIAVSVSRTDYHKLLSDPLSAARKLPMIEFSVSSMYQTYAERYLGHRDGIFIGIALENYRRHHDGNYPASLAQLQPALIPALPEDRITGHPLHYRLIDGKPLVYSVGDDRDDDGGQPPVIQPDDPRGPTGYDLTAQWRPQSSAHDGDWVLYPQPAATH